MRWGVVVVMLLVGVASFSCKEDAVAPPLEPPGRQHDIPWPSLADSPWPMHHGNPQSTGRTKYLGPQSGQISWMLPVPGVLSTIGFTSPVVGADSTIYFGSSYEPGPSTQQSFLYAIARDGSIKWKFRIGTDSLAAEAEWITTGPIVASDGTIYLGSKDGSLYAVNADGTLKWAYPCGAQINYVGMNIGLDGTIYFVAMNLTLYAVESVGSLKWTLFLDGGFDPFAGIAFSPDGSTMYLPGYVSRGSKTLYAVGIDRSVEWVLDDAGWVVSTPLVDSQGNIYIGPNSDDSTKAGFYCLSPTGEIRWRYGAEGTSFREPTIDLEGNTYFATADGDLVSVDYNGRLSWKMPGFFLTSLVCDSQNTIFGWDRGFVAVGSAGNVLWRIPLAGDAFNSPLISSNGSLYLGAVSPEKVFYAVK